MQKKVSAGIILATVIVVSIIFLVATYTITNRVRIRTFNLDCDTSSIDWGELTGGEVVSYTIHVMPKGKMNSTLSIVTQKWVPSNANDYITLTTDYENMTLQPNIWYPITLTLSLSSNIYGIENITFDIVLTATEVN